MALPWLLEKEDRSVNFVSLWPPKQTLGLALRLRGKRRKDNRSVNFVSLWPPK